MLFLISFTVVGIYSATQKQNTTTDYLLASRNVNPWLTALSAMATGQSGFLFIGSIGFSYRLGFASIWVALAWTIGNFIAWCFIFKKLRSVSQQIDSDTVSSIRLNRYLNVLNSESEEDRRIALISSRIRFQFKEVVKPVELMPSAGHKCKVLRVEC